MQLQYQIANFNFNTKFHEKTNREKGKTSLQVLKKIFRIALAVLRKQNASSTIPLIKFKLDTVLYQISASLTFQESYCKCGFPQLKNSYEVNPQSNM